MQSDLILPAYSSRNHSASQRQESISLPRGIYILLTPTNATLISCCSERNAQCTLYKRHRILLISQAFGKPYLEAPLPEGQRGREKEPGLDLRLCCVDRRGRSDTTNCVCGYEVGVIGTLMSVVFERSERI